MDTNDFYVGTPVKIGFSPESNTSGAIDSSFVYVSVLHSLLDMNLYITISKKYISKK